MRFEVATDPVQKVLTTIPDRRLNPVVDADESNPTGVDQLLKVVEPVVEVVPRSTVAVRHDGISVIHGSRIFGPAITVDRRDDRQSRVVDPFGQQQTPRVVLVGSPVMARLTSDEDDLLAVGQLQPFEADVFELDLLRRTGVHLQGQQSDAVSLLARIVAWVLLVIEEFAGHMPVNLQGDVVPLAEDRILVPVRGLNELEQLITVGHRLQSLLAFDGDLCPAPTGSKTTASRFVVQ